MLMQGTLILKTISILASAITTNAAPIPRESALCNATEHQIIIAESFISGILDEVKSGKDDIFTEQTKRFYFDFVLD